MGTINEVASSTASAYTAPAKTETKATAAPADKAAEAGATYEHVEAAPSPTYNKINKMSKEDRAALVQQLEADSAAREAAFTDQIRKMMTQQVGTYGQANSIWEFLANGQFTVDAATKAQAEADIAEDGYWGVAQTSQRIFDMASALAGDDEQLMKKMQTAFEKGFKQAEGTWTKKLPDISYRTKEAVNSKFDDWYAKKAEEKSQPAESAAQTDKPAESK